ncbi:TetR/AcrR family transcriptional regulator [Streptomyces cucumeris]|uniref:TetR/AcrR family transcriptional regulator n=1 Tax=Streptomyces cucumeris TaxID=2962890 RepID=UPI003D714D7B
MGHREDLLAGAKRCLLEKGWSRTTARDIVAASGANLASIGYHYGSKDALMREALFAAMGDWADDVQRSLADGAATGSDPAGRFESGWTRALELFSRHQAVWRAQLEAVMQAERDPGMREAFAAAQPEARQALVALLHGTDGRETDEETSRTLGSFYMTLVSGMVVQMAIDPELTPDARELIEAMRLTSTSTSTEGPASA